MTTLGLNWEQHLEARRHNAEQERETLRHNKAMEKEANRAALESERLKGVELDIRDRTLAEQYRANTEGERIKSMEADEKERANREKERNDRLKMAFDHANGIYSKLVANGLLTQEVANDFMGVADNLIRILAGIDVNDTTENNFLRMITDWTDYFRSVERGHSGTVPPADTRFYDQVKETVNEIHEDLKTSGKPSTTPPKPVVPKQFTFEAEEPATWSTQETRQYNDEQLKATTTYLDQVGAWIDRNLAPIDTLAPKANPTPDEKGLYTVILRDGSRKKVSRDDYLSGDYY